MQFYPPSKSREEGKSPAPTAGKSVAWALDHTEPQIPQGMVIGQDAIKSSKGEGEDLWRNIVLKESFFKYLYSNYGRYIHNHYTRVSILCQGRVLWRAIDYEYLTEVIYRVCILLAIGGKNLPPWLYVGWPVREWACSPSLLWLWAFWGGSCSHCSSWLSDPPLTQMWSRPLTGFSPCLRNCTIKWHWSPFHLEVFLKWPPRKFDTFSGSAKRAAQLRTCSSAKRQSHDVQLPRDIQRHKLSKAYH